MKKLLLLLTFSAVVLTASATLTTLFEFSMQNFTGWDYSYRETEVNATNISMNRISLYTMDNGESRTLCSPRFTPTGYTAVTIESTIVSPNVGENKFNLNVAYPTFELIDNNDNVVSSRDYYLTKAELINNLKVTLDIPQGYTGQLRLRLAAWRADLNSYISVRRVILSSGKDSAPGDVNTDGEVNVSDVTLLVNMILGTATRNLSVADLDGDGDINVTDVTALVNIILSAAE